jgi:alkylation response protein AidB-like acyl-CoA dehydrogenase
MTTQDTADSEARQQIDMLRASAADYVARNTDFKRLRERRGALPGYDPAHLRRMADLGWLGIVVPGEQGGLGLGFAELAVVLQELGKGLMADPLAPAALAARTLWHGASGELKARLLPRLADASLRPCVAWQEGLGGLDPTALQTRIESDGADFALTGVKRFVAGAAGADGFIVSARGAAGCGLYWLAANAPGLRLSHEWRADGTPAGVLTLERARVAAADVLTPASPRGLAALERALDEAAVMASAEMLGVIEAALNMALDYMRTRVQFGQPIGGFQALQHKAVDLYVQQELLRAVLQDAVRALDAGGPADERARLASRCKARASDAGLRVTREVIQLHGAIGYTDEYDAGLYLKRALVLAAWLGNGSAHRQRFAALHAREPGV